MLADEITSDLRAIRTEALKEAKDVNHSITRPLISKGISYGTLTANSDGTLDTHAVQGVNTDLRVRPFFATAAKRHHRPPSLNAFPNPTARRFSNS